MIEAGDEAQSDTEAEGHIDVDEIEEPDEHMDGPEEEFFLEDLELGNSPIIQQPANITSYYNEAVENLPSEDGTLDNLEISQVIEEAESMHPNYISNNEDFKYSHDLLDVHIEDVDASALGNVLSINETNDSKKYKDRSFESMLQEAEVLVSSP